MGIKSFLERNKDVLGMIYGSIDDIDVKSKWSDVQTDMAKYKTEYQNYLAYQDLAGKIGNYQLSDEDIGKLVKTKYAPGEGFDTHPEVTGSEVYKNWQSIPDNIMGIPSNKPADYFNYLQNNSPEELKRLQDAGLIKSEYIKPTDEELTGYIAGKILKPEEVTSYNTLKQNPVDPGKHNLGLKELMIKKGPGLVSEGSLTDQIANQFLREAGLYEINPKQEEMPNIRFDEKNNLMIGYDKKGNILFTKPYYKEEVKKDEKNAFGKYKTMAWEDILALPPNEVYSNFGAFSPEMQAKLKAEYPELFAEDVTSSSSSTRRRSGPKLPKLDITGVFDTKTISDLQNFNLLNSVYDAHQRKDEYGDLTEEDEKWNNDRRTLENELMTRLGINDPEELKRKATVIGNEPNPEDIQKIFKGKFAKGETDEDTFKYFEDYVKALDEAYAAEQNGTQPKGYYNSYKNSFLTDLERYRRYLSQEDYEFLYNSYK